MNDTERDAWLREALRHAPDAGAAPPPLLSDAILAKARAAAAETMPRAAPRRTAATARPANGLLAFWAWLARPPVAAGFASVMAATLVGLMWWDRPMDETLPPPPALEHSQAPGAAAPTAGATPAAPPLLEEKSVPEATSTREPVATARGPQRAAKATDAVTAQRTAPKDALDKARGSQPPSMRAQSPAQTADSAEPLRKRGAPAPFPSSEFQRPSAGAAAPLADAKKESAATLARVAPAPPSTATLPAATPAPAVAAATTAEAERAPAPLVSGRFANDEAGRAAANNVDDSTAKSLPARQAEAKVAAGVARDAAPAEASAPAPPGQRAATDTREKDAQAFGPSGAATGRSESARRDATAAAPAPLAPLLAALARDGPRWSRQAAAGTVRVEPAWRDWLVDLDAAAAGRWRSAPDAGALFGADAAKDGGTTVRLFRDGRLAASVRLDGATARIDAQVEASPEHWQAVLAPGAAERLRATRTRLPP